MVKSNIPECRE